MKSRTPILRSCVTLDVVPVVPYEIKRWWIQICCWFSRYIYIYYLYVYINTYHIVVTIGRKTAMHLVIFIDSAAACELDRDSWSTEWEGKTDWESRRISTPNLRNVNGWMTRYRSCDICCLFLSPVSSTMVCIILFVCQLICISTILWHSVFTDKTITM